MNTTTPILSPVDPTFGSQLTARSGGMAITPPAEEEDAILGIQLTAEYHRAVGGMRAVLTFGAMMMQLRDRLALPNATVAFALCRADTSPTTAE